MRIADVYAAAPGSRFLVSCPARSQEDMTAALCAAMPEDFRRRTRLNASPIASMDMAPDENPNRFSDLLGLCGKLITAAGQRSHFEGLLLLGVGSLSETGRDGMRLKALGELLAMPDGLASRCITVLYGPHKEKELLACADALDFDGHLKVFAYEQPSRLALATLLDEAGLRCADSLTESLLEATLKEFEKAEGFSASKLLRICGNGHGIITSGAIAALNEDPYSYIGRIRRGMELRQDRGSVSRIGFLPDR